MEETVTKLQMSVEFLTPFLNLVNSHMVEFFNKKLWNELIHFDLKRELSINPDHPDNIVDLFQKTYFEKDSALGNFLHRSFEFYPKVGDNVVFDFETFISKQKQFILAENNLMFNNNSFMSEKKEHEVKIMSSVVSTISSFTNSSIIVDIGDGKGYLSSFLSMKKELKVLGLDSCSQNTLSAARRASKIQKRHSCKGGSSTSKVNNILPDEGGEMSDATSMSYKQMTMFISSETDLMNLLDKNFPSESAYKFGIVGLHTCGSLSPVCLKLFVNSSSDASFLLNVGCCYHLLDEVQESNESYTFPLSDFLKKMNFRLGRNARMLSLQASERIYSHKKIPDSLMFRAVFQCYLESILGDGELSKIRVGRIGSKCRTFEEYCKKGLTKLGLEINASDAELQDYFKIYQSEQYFLNCFFMLRVTLAPIIEYIILLDRLVYLQENGLQNSVILKLFDSCISPRCFAILSIKN